MSHQKSSVEWESLLQIAVFSYNVALHKNLGFSPFFLTYLHPPNIPIFNFDFEKPQITSWPEEVLDSMTKIYDQVVKNLNDSLPTPTGKFRHFKVGDRVLVSFPKQLTASKEHPQGNPKFNPNYQNNYTIIRKLTESAFHVKRPYGKTLVVNADRLKIDPAPPPSSCRGPITRSMAKVEPVYSAKDDRKPKIHYLQIEVFLRSWLVRPL